jgi:hypothetical protein
MTFSMDPLEKERKALASWKDKLPDDMAGLRDMNALEALGELKKRGHIKSITLVNAPPRSVSTIITKCLAESPALKLRGLPVFHEVLDDSGQTTYYPNPSDVYNYELRTKKNIAAQGEEFQHYLGSNILMGKLLDSGIAEKKSADVVLKIMSHDFQGPELQKLLPHVDNVVSTLRQPAQHIQCVQRKVMDEKAFDLEATYNVEQDMNAPMRKYWDGFVKNVNDIDKWQSEHPKQKMRHAVISGDKFLNDPVDELKFVCEQLNKDRAKGDAGYMEFGPRMLSDLSTPVYFSYVDAWGKNEIASKKFQPEKKYEIFPVPREKLDPALHKLCDELDVPFGKILARHPHAILQAADRTAAADAIAGELAKRPLPSGSQDHYTAQMRATVGLEANWREQRLADKLEASRNGPVKPAR